MPSRQAKLLEPGFPPLQRVSLNVKRHRSIQNVIVINLNDPRQIPTLRRPNPRLVHGSPPNKKEPPRRSVAPRSPSHSTFRTYRISHPKTAAAATTQAEFTRNRSSAIKLMPNTTSVVRSTIDAFPNCIATTAINASDPATTPSSAAAATADLRSRGISGPLTATSTNPGKKIPIVATAAPIQPATTYPINVAVVNSGPGVNWPTATASINCFSVSQCRRSTNSVCRNASRTYPLPNTTEPIFRNDRNSRKSPTGQAAPTAATAIAPATMFGNPNTFWSPTIFGTP